MFRETKAWENEMVSPPHEQSRRDGSNVGWFRTVACPRVLQSCPDWGKEAFPHWSLKGEKTFKGKENVQALHHFKILEMLMG